jgi:PDZ domain-containing protein
MPAPYAIGRPGPTYDTLGEIDGVPLVSVEGVQTYQTTGQLRLTTVGISEGSSSIFTLGTVIKSWLSPFEYVVPEEIVFGEEDDQEAFEQVSQQAWITSQESAAVSALEALGTTVLAELTVAAVGEDSDALGRLQAGDRLIAFEGRPLSSFSGLSRELDNVTPGADVTVTVERDGGQQEVTFATTESPDGGALMGIFLDPDFDLPIEVNVDVGEAIGGPSAGLMFSLAIMDLLTPEDELDGARVAGTGAVTADGDVRPIGGIRLKMHGAAAAAADYFLAPVDNCAEAVGHEPVGLQVVAVATVGEAYAAIESIGRGDIDALSSCETVVTP